MDDKSVYATQQGFLYNIQWYIRVKDEVEQLRDRIAFLNIKVPRALVFSDCRSCPGTGLICLTVVDSPAVPRHVRVLSLLAIRVR